MTAWRFTPWGKAYRDIFGYLPQEFGFYPGFSVQDYLEYMATLKGLPKGEADRKIKELLSRLTLEDVKRKKISKLSGGMKRRVGIAQALLNDPEVLILDEPTSGLDPGERVRFRNLLSEFARDRIVLISTHIVSDIEYISTKKCSDERWKSNRGGRNRRSGHACGRQSLAGSSATRRGCPV